MRAVPSRLDITLSVFVRRDDASLLSIAESRIEGITISWNIVLLIMISFDFIWFRPITNNFFHYVIVIW